MSSDNTIYYLTHDDIKDEKILFDHIYPDENTNYYFSDDFSKEFYIKLAKAGFISTTTFYNDKQYLLPEIQFEYSILDFEDLHISKKVEKLIRSQNFIFSVNKNFDEVLVRLDEYHKPNWLTDEYKFLLKGIQEANYLDFQVKSFEILDKDTKEIIAAEVGYFTNNIYTSLTGFSSKEKKYNNYGKLQLVLLALYLQKINCSFWNLGHPYMQYKFDLGAKMYSRNDFLKRWYE